jgi:hypothetical protein
MCVQVQNALNARVNLQCSLLLTNLDLPLALNGAELRSQDDVQQSEQLSMFVKADADEVRSQVNHLLSVESSWGVGVAGALVVHNKCGVEGARGIGGGRLQAEERARAEEISGALEILRDIELRLEDQELNMPVV